MDLEILLTKNCQLKCEYCSLYGKDDKLELQPRLENLIKIKDKIQKVFILGGEPTKSQYLDDILDLFKDKEITIFTNTININKLLSLNSTNINLICSYHSYIDFNLFLKNIFKLRTKFNISVCIMKETDNPIFDEYYEKLRKLKINTELNPIFLIQNNNGNKQILKTLDYIPKDKNSIANRLNTNLNLKFYEIFKKIEQNKKCNIQDNVIYYNFLKNKFNRCLTYDLFNIEFNKCDNCCNLKFCLNDLEYIYEI